MRALEFPFAKYREWGTVPTDRPELDVDAIADLNSWQDNIFKRPMLDDITGYYQFFPSENGVMSYATRAAKKRPVLEKNVEPGDTLEQKRERKLIHIGEVAELATAVFWATALMRHDVISTALGQVVDLVERHVVGELRSDVAAYSSDAIADHGYCLLYPVQVDHKGEDHGKNLADQIERVAPEVGKNLLGFGNYSIDHPEVLQSYDGIVALQATLFEQERRIKHWAPRHGAILDAFEGIGVSQEVVHLDVDFPELFLLHNRVKVGS